MTSWPAIEALADWPDDNVEWDKELLALVESVMDDSDLAERQLQGQPAQFVGADEVVSMLGTGWRADLTSFQRRDIAHLLSMQHGANFSVPGAGKTRVGMAVYSAMKEQGKVRRLLVVSPKSAYESWLFEAGECFEEPPVTTVMAGAPDPSAEILILNYERLDKSLNALAGWLRAAPSMVILDEAHRMKLGARGIYGSACMALGPLSRRRLILTGTPAPNGARDLENLLSFVWPGQGRRIVTNAVDGETSPTPARCCGRCSPERPSVNWVCRPSRRGSGTCRSRTGRCTARSTMLWSAGTPPGPQRNVKTSTHWARPCCAC